MPNQTQDGVLKANLEQVGYSGDPWDCSSWDVVVEFEVLPNGRPEVTVTHYPDVTVGHGTLPAEQPAPAGDFYVGPGGYHGVNLPEAILCFRVSVSGQDGRGNPIEGATEALIAHASSDWVHPQQNYCISVPLPPPPPQQGTPPQPPSLWFNFSVATVC